MKMDQYQENALVDFFKHYVQLWSQGVMAETKISWSSKDPHVLEVTFIPNRTAEYITLEMTCGNEQTPSKQ